MVGPFGISVMTSKLGEELTPVYLEMIPLGGGGWETRACTDQTRSSLRVDGDKNVYGSTVRVLPNETELTFRIIVGGNRGGGVRMV